MGIEVSRQGRLTIHSCKPCGKPQIHVDVQRKPATLPVRHEGEEQHPIHIWRTVRKCRECGHLITGSSIRMIPKEKGGTWERGRKA